MITTYTKQKRIKVCELATDEAINLIAGICQVKCKSGVWNDFEPFCPYWEAQEKIKKSPYGATVCFVYDGEPREDDENLLYAEVIMPSASDMY